ncbi:MAG: hypothetical protein ACYDH6_08480 [Acidimicrobiales bacterium]
MHVVVAVVATVLLLGLVLGVPYWAIRDAHAFTGAAWGLIGRSRLRWARAFALGPLFLVGPIAAAV